MIPLNRIAGSRLLISKLPGSALRTLIESFGKPRDVNKHSRQLKVKVAHNFQVLSHVTNMKEVETRIINSSCTLIASLVVSVSV